MHVGVFLIQRASLIHLVCRSASLSTTFALSQLGNIFQLCRVRRFYLMLQYSLCRHTSCLSTRPTENHDRRSRHVFIKLIWSSSVTSQLRYNVRSSQLDRYFVMNDVGCHSISWALCDADLWPLTSWSTKLNYLRQLAANLVYSFKMCRVHEFDKRWLKRWVSLVWQKLVSKTVENIALCIK